MQTPSFLQKSRSISRTDDFAQFYEAAYLNLYRYALTLCAGNTTEAEDLTAEAFLRAWDKRDQFTGPQPEAMRWVVTIVRNLFIDRYRQTNGTGIETLEETSPAPEIGIEQILVAKEQLQQVMDAIHNLPLRQRDIFSLRYLLGWRVQEIASHLHLPENNISVDLRRALNKLKIQLTSDPLGTPSQGGNHEK